MRNIEGRLRKLEQETAGGGLWFVLEVHDDFPDRDEDIARALSDAGETRGDGDTLLVLRRFSGEMRTPARFLYKFRPNT